MTCRCLRGKRWSLETRLPPSPGKIIRTTSIQDNFIHLLVVRQQQNEREGGRRRMREAREKLLQVAASPSYMT